MLAYSLAFVVERVSTGIVIDSRVEVGVDLTAFIDALALVTFPAGHAEFTVLTELVLPLARVVHTQIVPVIGTVNVAHYESWKLAIYQAYMASLSITLTGGMYVNKRHNYATSKTNAHTS